MRGNQDLQGAMFSDISLEERVPPARPLRKLRAVVDTQLATMSSQFEAVYARRGRPSVPQEMLLTGQVLLCFATYNLVRMGSIGGWWDAHHA